MFYQANASKSLGLIIFLGLLLSPVSAHKVEISGDVGGTLHIEPHDNPQAGKPTQAWIALTRKGGQIIPLAQCNCQMTVYSKPHVEGSAPLMKPPLKAVSVQQYKGVPGAEVVFPKPGAYELELSGTPKAGAGFKPFRLTYTVTVGTGTSQNHTLLTAMRHYPSTPK